MATLPPPEDMPIPETNEPAEDPWAQWRGAGIDPSYDPQQARQAIGFWDALRNRDQRDYALEQLVRNELPDGMSWRDARELLAQQSQKPSPWDGLGGGDPGYADPAYADQNYQQPPALDPNALREAIEYEMEQRFAARDAAAEESRRQQAYESEFTSEASRVAKQHKLDDHETLYLAAEANMLRASMPYAPTSQLMDEAGKRYVASVNSRLQALSQIQEGSPAAPLPGGPIPSDQQVPQNAQEAQEAARRFFNN